MIYMLHSVGNTHADWALKFLSVKLYHLEKFLKQINKNKIKTFFIKDLYEFNFITPKNSIALSFDDGYLDNWVFLFPLLKRYNIKASIFVNPEFVDNRNIMRGHFNKELEVKDQDSSIGFLSWLELIEMEKSGLVDIQSHSMSHTWFYSGKVLKDFFAPYDIQKKMPHDRKYPWISWNEKPELKPFTHNSNSYFSKNIGQPILENGRSLGIKRFFLDDDIKNSMVQFTKNNTDVFCNNDWFSILKKEYDQLIKNKKSIGRFETKEETNSRYYYELADSKKILEEKLKKNIDILCWPGGAYNNESLKASEDMGYLASTISSKENGKIFDNTGKKYKRIPRLPLSGNIGVKGKSYGTSKLSNILFYKYKSDFYSKLIIKTEKITRLIINK